MRFNKLDLNLLVALNALLSHRSIARAADAVNLSPSAMSNALARLREYFDDELLVQVGRKMEPTPRAESLQDSVRDVLLRIDSTIAAQPEFDPTLSDREFLLLLSDYSIFILMPHVLARASRMRSRVRFKFMPQVQKPDRMLERGEADMLIIPKAYCSPEHPTEALLEEDFTCVVWRDGRLAAGELSFEHYANAGHVVMQPTEHQPASYEGWFLQRYGMSRRVEVTSYNFSSIPALIVGTDLIATVHTRLARWMANALPVVLKPVPVPIPPLSQAMQWHKYRSQDPGLIWLRALMQDAVKDIDKAG